MNIAGKIVQSFEGDAITFTDGSAVEISGRDAEIDYYSPEQWESLTRDRGRAKAIMGRAWAEHRAAINDPAKVLAGWGGFYRLPDAEPWPNWREDVAWLDRYNNNSRGSFDVEAA